jgi:succinoglycan biosynthesis transport protein ExoP
MAQEIKGFAEHFDGFKRHLKLAVATFAVVVAIGVGFAYSLPDVYKSQGYILIEEPAIPTDILRSTVTTYATRQLTILNEKILTIPTMIRLVEEFNLYPDQRSSTPVELLAGQARQSIAVQIQSRESVNAQGVPGLRAVGFTVSFEDENPETTKAVADELVALYLEENRKVRSEQTSETADFLEGEVEKMEEAISELEGKLASFKEKNSDRMPSMNGVNMQMMTRLDGQILALEAELQQLQQVRLSIESQLATIDPSVPVRLADGSFAMSPADQLRQLQTQLTVYQSRYSDDNPDVIATKRDIESLRTRFGLDANSELVAEELLAAKADLALALERYSPDHPDVKQLERTIDELEQARMDNMQRQMDATIEPDNPAYIQLKVNLDSIDIEEGSLKKQIAMLKADMADYERRIMETPQVEKELNALTRQLNSTSNRYWVMRDKQFAAEMGETLETESKGEEMVVVEPPRVPLRPYKPNRGAIIILAFMFALVAGVGITQLIDSIDTSIRGGAAIVSVQGVPPLVEVPYIYTELEIARAMQLKKIALVSIAPVALILVVVLHFTVLPLDVLWYSIARRVGL